MATRVNASKRKNEELEEDSVGGEEVAEGAAAAAAAAPTDAEAVASQLRISDEHFAHGSNPDAMSLVDAFPGVQQLCLLHVPGHGSTPSG